jgi:hypothetical protein
MDQTLDRQPVGVPMVLEPAANDLTKLFHNLLSSLHRQNGARVKANYQRDDAPSWLKFRQGFQRQLSTAVVCFSNSPSPRQTRRGPG